MFPYLLCLLCAVVLVVSCGGQTVDRNITYGYSISEDAVTGWHIVTLTADNSGDPKNSIAASIATEGGNNMFSCRVGDHELIDASEDIGELINGGRGNPILFPTPNRVRDATYVFMGETLKMSFPDETRSHMLHGLVKDDTAWRFKEPEVRQDGVYFETWYVFDENNPRFPAYPFKCTLTVRYAVKSDRVMIGYEVANQDEKPLGFGFGLHPFWKAVGGKDKTLIRVDLPYHMEATENLIPTGRIEPVDGTVYDLSEPRPVSELRLDDVYLGATPESAIRVIFKAIGLEIHQRATEDFTHIVVYTPDREYFCVENQTCSTDAHNLYARGLIEESHLQIVEPGENTGGHVDYIFSWNE